MKKYNYIYTIRNTFNNKIYVGKHSTNNLNDGYMGSGILISRAIDKYGIENFIKEYLIFCDREEKLNYFEKYYISKYNARENGYNIALGGEGGITWIGECPAKYRKPFLGKTHSEITKKKISDAHKGKKRKPFSEETRKKMSEAAKGKYDHRGEKNPNWKGGKKEKIPVPREIINKHISESKMGSIPWNKGKHHTEETKQKIREAKLKRKRDI